MSYLPPEHANEGEQLAVEYMTELYPATVDDRRLDADLRSRERENPLVRVLVCVKRVPITGGRMVLTDDAQALDTKHLGFTISPHEECGVEEAVRIVEAGGGEVVVLTLGPAEAEEQLRDCIAIGADRGILLKSDGRSGIAQATAAAIVDAVRGEEPFDLILFGNESADAGNYQVGIRVAYALGLPVVTGLKKIEVQGDRVRCERDVGGARDVYEVAAAGGADRARGPEPAALPVRARAACARSRSRSPSSSPRGPTRSSRSCGSSCPRARASRPRSSARARTQRRGSSRSCSSSGSRERRPGLARLRRGPRAAVTSLREHLVHGRLSLEEFMHRMSGAYAATTAAELSPLESDLPSGEIAASPRRRSAMLALSGTKSTSGKPGTLRPGAPLVRVNALVVFGAANVKVIPPNAEEDDE